MERQGLANELKTARGLVEEALRRAAENERFAASASPADAPGYLEMAAFHRNRVKDIWGPLVGLLEKLEAKRLGGAPRA
jgi:hypothetical protein